MNKKIIIVVLLGIAFVIGIQVLTHTSNPAPVSKTVITQEKVSNPTPVSTPKTLTPEEAYKLGFKYETQKRPDFKKAMSLYKEAYIYPPAMRQLAALYLTGLAGETNVDLATNLMFAAASNNDPQAQGLIAGFYLYGLFPKNTSKALFWAQKGADNGDPLSQYILGVSYMQGQGVPVDTKTAYKWIYMSTRTSPSQDKLDMLNDLTNRLTTAEIENIKRGTGHTPTPPSK
jgi:hypothetical protein